MHRSRWITIFYTAALLVPLAETLGFGQEPPVPPPASTPATPAPGASSSKSGKKKYSHANDFLIHGTVFDSKALSAPGVQLRIRRTGEKKFRWESYTNSRGEFAVRVPQGSDYEMVIRAKGFAEQTHAINAKSGGNEESIVFRMQPVTGGKT